MSKLKAAQRVVLGRNITLTAGAVYALSRALSYATMRPDTMNQAQAVITAEGRISWLWVAAWGAAAIFCVADMVNKHTRYGLSAVVGIALAWGVGHLATWVLTGFQDPSLIALAIGWLTPAGLVLGFLIKVTALQDMLRKPPGGPDE